MIDPYVYEGTDVLVNHFGIRDGDGLDRAERVVAELAVFRQMQAPLPASFGLGHLLDVHAGIFGEIYPFAGKPRTVPVGKQEHVLSGRSVAYAEPDGVAAMADEAIAGMEACAANPSRADFAEALALLWRAHPFREGNTRAVLVFLHQFCLAHGHPLDFEVLSRSPQDVRDALALAASGVPDRLAAKLSESFRSARRRNHPVLGFVTAEAADFLERFEGIPVSMAEDGDRVRGQVGCVSHSTVIVQTAKGVVAAPLSCFAAAPDSGDRVDLSVYGRDSGPDGVREAVRAFG